MPPILALALCAGFTVWLFRRDVAFRGRMPPGMWVPFIWLLILGSRPVTSWLHIGGRSIAEGNPVEALIVFAQIFAAVLVLQRRRFPIDRTPRLNVTFFLILGYFLLSTVWAPFPLIAFKRWFKEFGNLLVVLVIVSEADPGESFRGVCVRCAYLLFPLSVVLYKYYPQFGRAYSGMGVRMVTGVTEQKNSLGLICAVFGFALVWDIFDARSDRALGPARWRRLLPQLLTLGIGIWLLLACQSKTSLLALIAGLAIFFGPQLGIVRRSASAFAKTWTIAVPVLLILAAVNTVMFAPALEAIGRNTTFTDRTHIWHAVLAQHTNPVIGTGFFSFWLEYEEGVRSMGIPQTEAHDGYLEIYLDGGAIGCALLALFLFTTCWRLANAYSADSSFTRAMFAFAIMALITNFSEAYFFRRFSIWFALVFAALTIKGISVLPPASAKPPDLKEALG